jgi:acetate kinase
LKVLVVNAGSSSLKLSVLDDKDVLVADAHVEDWDGSDMAPLVDLASGVDAVGHRVVHGGTAFRDATRIDKEVMTQLRALVPLAPLHQDRALAGISTARAAVGPDVPQVACFDTSYHATLSPAAATYALPAEWRSRWPLRRFGFHGLSHAYAAGWAASELGRAEDPDVRIVTCHLGAGASLCASRGGRSVDTTMGFTPLEGLVMASRSGTVDPGLVLWLIQAGGMSADAVQDGLEHASGLTGLAGTPDMEQVISRAADGDDDAQLGLDVYLHVLCREIGAMTASLGGLDALVFTGGVGENAPSIRDAAAERLAHLLGDAPTLVVEAREDVEIARQTRAALS